MKVIFSDASDALRIILDKLERWMHKLVGMLPNILLAAIVLISFIFLAKLLRNLSLRFLNRISHQVAINRLVATFIHIGVFFVGVFIALGLLNLDKTVTSLLAGAGIIGLALSFAFQDTAANFISGVILALRRPLNVGDIVQLKSHFGTVERINLRATLLRTQQGQIIIIPNKDILQNPIENFSYTGERRIDLKGSVSYGDDLEKVKTLTLEVIKTIDYLKEGRDVDFYFEEFDDYSINFVVRYWINFYAQRQYLQAVSDGIMLIKKAYEENGITIPYPIRTLDFGIKRGEKLSDMWGKEGL